MEVLHDECLKPYLSSCTASRTYKCRCKRCVDWLIVDNKRVNDHPVTRAAKVRWKRNNPDRIKAATKKWMLNHPEKVLAKQLRKFGLTVDQYRALGDVCAICGHPPSGSPREKRLFVDHDHTTGLVRGVLCNTCNVGLANFKDSAALLACAIAYLWNNNEDKTAYTKRSIERAFGPRGQSNVE